MKLLHVELFKVKEALAVGEEGRRQAEKVFLGVKTELRVSELMRHTLAENLGVAEHNLVTIQTHFEKVEKIWSDETGTLIDHLKA